MMILVITQSNSGTGRSPVANSPLMDFSKADTISVKKALPLKTKKDETPTKHRQKAVSDTTSEQSESEARKHDEASD